MIMAQTLTLVGLAGGDLWEPDQGIHLTTDPLNDPPWPFLTPQWPPCPLLIPPLTPSLAFLRWAGWVPPSSAALS